MRFHAHFAYIGAKRRVRSVSDEKNEGKMVMNVQKERPGAQILQFPPPDIRARLAAQRQAKLKIKSDDLQMAPVAFGGAWYHDAAIADTDRTRNS